jgi:hypothetical protein
VHSDTPNRPVFIIETESVIKLKTLPQRKLDSPGGFTGKFYQMFKEETIPILYELLQKKRREQFPAQRHYKERKLQVTMLEKMMFHNCHNESPSYMNIAYKSGKK